MEFPQYRKLSNGLRLYKISSHDAFEEIQIMGKKATHFRILASQYPEKLRILDMLGFSEGFEQLEESVWNLYLQQVNA